MIPYTRKPFQGWASTACDRHVIIPCDEDGTPKVYLFSGPPDDQPVLIGVECDPHSAYGLFYFNHAYYAGCRMFHSAELALWHWRNNIEERRLRLTPGTFQRSQVVRRARFFIECIERHQLMLEDGHV